MTHKNKVLVNVLSLILLMATSIFLNSQQGFAHEKGIKMLEEKMQILMEEMETLKEKQPEGIEDKIHFHGYGELHYNNTSKDGENDKMDFHRMVLGWTYHFEDQIVLDAEVDFEHAAEEMELEYAHISFLRSDNFNIRMGSMLMPVGYLNEFHEPPLFYSVERPYVQKNVIPTTWQEGGVGIFGSPNDDFHYRLYLVGGLDARKFKASSGIRGGRGKVKEAKADDLAIVGRIEYGGVNGLNLGLSGYLGDAAQGNSSLGDATVRILEGDIRYRWEDLEFTGLVASVNVDDTDKINAVTGEVIGEEILGWYIEGAYHLGNLFAPEEDNIVLFVRHEQFNTQEEVLASLSADPANEQMVTTFGLAYFPTPEVAIKADLESWENKAEKEWHQFNIGVAYMF